MKTSIILILILAFSLNMDAFAQEKPFRIGVKLGYPNALGGNIEYVLPFFGKKLAPTLDLSFLKEENYLDPDKATYNYYGGGLNYYFLKEGKGLYAHAGYGSGKFELITQDEFSSSGEEGIGFINVENNSFQLKLGAKWGKGFYFRPEVGYSTTRLPDEVDKTILYADGTSSISKVDIPSQLTGGLLFNIGIGVAF